MAQSNQSAQAVESVEKTEVAKKAAKTASTRAAKTATTSTATKTTATKRTTSRTARTTATKATTAVRSARTSKAAATKSATAKRPASSAVFNARLAAHQDELEQLFMSLYNDHDAFDALVASMAAAYADRPADLKRLDKTREQDPGWYKRGDMFGMTMYTDLFAGDLKKLADKIPYLKEQKLTYLHLMPLLDMPHPNNDGGYAVQDFDTVDPKLGTNEDLAALAKKLRRAGISLCIDFVMNHTASTHRWAKAAEAGDPEYQDYYFCYPDRTIPDRYDRDVPQVFPNTAPGNFTWNEKMNKWVMTQFYPFQWDLNYRNLPQVHTIVRMLRIILECVCPAVVLKGEVVMAPQGARRLLRYARGPRVPHAVQRLHHGQPVERARQPRRASAQEPDRQAQLAARKLLVRELFALP